MKINKIYNKLAVSVITVASLFAVSCQEDDLNIAKKGKPTLTLESNEVTIAEGFNAVFKANLSYPINDVVAFRMDLLDDNGNVVLVTEPDGEANTGNGYIPLAFDDFNVDVTSAAYPAIGVWETWFEAGAFDYGYLGGTGYVFTADRNVTSFEFPIGAITDNLAEGTESFRFRLSSTSKMNAIVDQIITVNIEDLDPTTLDVLMDFDGSMTIDGTAFDKCGLDFDLLISDEIVSTPYAAGFFTTSYDTCNETLSAGDAGGPIDNDPTNWADGSIYSVYVDYWADNNASDPSFPSLPAAITADEDIPMDFVFTKVRDGVTTDLTLSFPSLYNTADTTSENDPAEEIGTNRVATIEIVGNNYVITNLITGETTTL